MQFICIKTLLCYLFVHQLSFLFLKYNAFSSILKRPPTQQKSACCDTPPVLRCYVVTLARAPHRVYHPGEQSSAYHFMNIIFYLWGRMPLKAGGTFPPSRDTSSLRQIAARVSSKSLMSYSTRMLAISKHHGT